MPDLAWDGTLLWGSGERVVYGFNTSGEIVRRFAGPFANNKSLAYDVVRNLIWVTSPRSAFYGLDNNGFAFRTLSSHNLNATGIAYWRDDPDGYQLYVLDNPGQNSAVVYKINIENDDIRFVTEIEPPEGGQPCGIEVSSDFLNYDWSFIVLENDPTNNVTGDRADVYQLGVFTGWLGMTPESGTISAGRNQAAVVMLDAAGLDTGVVRGSLTFTHNAVQDAFILPVTLTVTSLGVGDESPPERPEDYSINSVWPSPFNSSFTVEFTLPKEGEVVLRLFDIGGREAAIFQSGALTAGRHCLGISGDGLTSGVYFLTMQAGGEMRMVKVTSIK